MKRTSALLILVAITASAQAGPVLQADPYPPAAAPETVSAFIAESRQAIPCQLVPTDAGLQPACDLSMLSSPGTYTLTMTAVSKQTCRPTETGATCQGGGSAVSSPFVLTLSPSAAPTALRVVP